MRNYAYQGSPSYDPRFADWANKAGHSARHRAVVVAKAELRAFHKKNGHLPPRGHELFGRLKEYVTPSSNSFDREFSDWARAHGGYGQGQGRRWSEAVA